MKIGKFTFPLLMGGNVQIVTLDNLELTADELFAILETIGAYRKPSTQEIPTAKTTIPET